MNTIGRRIFFDKDARAKETAISDNKHMYVTYVVEISLCHLPRTEWKRRPKLGAEHEYVNTVDEKKY